MDRESRPNSPPVPHDPQLNKWDLQFCIRRLPKKVRSALKRHELCVAGGYIRAVILNEKINDIDLFTFNKDYAKEVAVQMLGFEMSDLDDKKRSEVINKKLFESEFAITMRKGFGIPVQIITRWTYNRPVDVLSDFDYTICQAVIWWDHYCGRWCSACGDLFYQDLAARRLNYTIPDRKEAAGGSLLRVLKYYQRGYRISLESMAQVLVRLLRGVDWDHGTVWIGDTMEIDESNLAMIIKSLLWEVDPQLDPDHILDGKDD